MKDKDKITALEILEENDQDFLNNYESDIY